MLHKSALKIISVQYYISFHPQHFICDKSICSLNINCIISLIISCNSCKQTKITVVNIHLQKSRVMYYSLLCHTEEQELMIAAYFYARKSNVNVLNNAYISLKTYPKLHSKEDPLLNLQNYFQKMAIV